MNHDRHPVLVWIGAYAVCVVFAIVMIFILAVIRGDFPFKDRRQMSILAGFVLTPGLNVLYGIACIPYMFLAFDKKIKS